MPVRELTELLQAEIMAALATGPASSALAHVYASDNGAKRNAHDPKNGDSAVVFAPVKTGGRTLGTNLSRCEMLAEIDLYFGDGKPEQGDARKSALMAAVDASLCGYFSTNLQRIGLAPNWCVVTERGMLQDGQNRTYGLDVKVSCVVPPSMRITV